MMSNLKRFANVDYQVFRDLAKDKSLSKYEKIGFPDAYREGYEELIFKDILLKLPKLKSNNHVVMDVGPGCSDLPKMVIELCSKKQHNLILVDSEEMLAHLPDENFIQKFNGLYPYIPGLFEDHVGRIDVLVCYSVLHYIFVDVPLFQFIDKSLSLLAPGGQMLIGDIPNASKRKRFFSSENGISFHQEFMKTNEKPKVVFNEIVQDQIDDSVMMAIVQRARSAGFDAYILPQHDTLPMSNRREDILITRP